ncbi:MAG: ROK family protein [Acidobacteria bacterium]|nr:ROK family protein [Acidobacteriota bacterium]
MTHVLAIDAGGTKTAVAVVDQTGRVRERRQVAAARTFDATVEQIAAAAATATGVAAIGVIVPGIYDARDGTAWCPNLWGDAHVPLRDAVRARVALPLAIDCDRSGYVSGEAWCGIARGASDVVFVAIGTGIGVGILAGGHVVAGAHGIAGAAGWSSLLDTWKDDYRTCGCWEGEAAGPALARAFGVPSAADVVSAAHAGDARARDVLLTAARHTGRGIANIVSLLNPEVVVLGGGVMQGAAPLVLDAIRDEAARWAQPIAFRRCRIELTTLGENAGLLGAARLALDEAIHS